MANVTEAEWKGNKERRECAVFLLLGLVVLSPVDNLGCKKFSPSLRRLPGKDSHAPQVKGVLHLEPFVVNLADSEDNRFLRVGIDLGLGNPSPRQGGQGRGRGHAHSSHSGLHPGGAVNLAL